MHSLSIFCAKTNHRKTQTHKIHHGPNLGVATTFPLIVYFVPFHEAHIQMAFCPGTPEIPKVGPLATLHKFVCKPLIVMMSKAKL
jgi:hypothetical protein